jgi:hypothetical protein
MAKRSAAVPWRGGLFDGSGVIKLSRSGALTRESYFGRVAAAFASFERVHELENSASLEESAAKGPIDATA